MICYVHSYKAREAEKDGKPLMLADRIILLRSELTHSEFQFSPRYECLSFSFTLADGANGARFKHIEYSHPNRWETIALPFTDEEEDLCFLMACILADRNKHFYTTINFGGTITATFDYGTKETTFKNDTIYQGPNHWRYDTKGLLTHALKKSGTWWMDILRGSLWCWTALIKPHMKKAWCSEGVAMVIKKAWPDFDGSPDKLDPQELDTELRNYKRPF